MYCTVIRHSNHLRTLEKCKKHSPAARVVYISLVFSNDCRVLSQYNTQLRLLYLLNIYLYITGLIKTVSTKKKISIYSLRWWWPQRNSNPNPYQLANVTYKTRDKRQLEKSRISRRCRDTRELKIQTFSGRGRREERLRLGRDWLRMRPRRRPHVGDVRSVGLPSRWKRELILFFYIIYCQFCHLYSSDCIITFRINHPTAPRPTQETFCFLLSSKWPKQHVLQWSPNCRSTFWAFMVESTRLQQELEGTFCQTWILLCPQLHYV